MALVIMGHGCRATLLERQPRLGAVERLDLGLLIDTEHHGAVRRVEVEPDDIGDLLLEHRIVRDLEALRDMRLEASFCPDAPTLDGEIPMASAISARLQCVALGGVSCTVLAMTFSRVSMGSGGTRAGRVLSRLRPATPSSRYRCCQRQTVGFDVRARRMLSKVP